jgi:hypothetical protein
VRNRAHETTNDQMLRADSARQVRAAARTSARQVGQSSMTHGTDGGCNLEAGRRPEELASETRPGRTPCRAPRQSHCDGLHAQKRPRFRRLWSTCRAPLLSVLAAQLVAFWGGPGDTLASSGVSFDTHEGLSEEQALVAAKTLRTMNRTALAASASLAGCVHSREQLVLPLAGWFSPAQGGRIILPPSSLDMLAVSLGCGGEGGSGCEKGDGTEVRHELVVRQARNGSGQNQHAGAAGHASEVVTRIGLELDPNPNFEEDVWASGPKRQMGHRGQWQMGKGDSRSSKARPNDQDFSRGNAQAGESCRGRAGESRKGATEEGGAGEPADEWGRAMQLLRAENSELILHEIVMNPLVAYSWCDYYLGDEVGRWIQDPSRCPIL